MDWKRVLVSALLAASGAIADVLLQMSSEGEFDGYEPLIIALVPFLLDRVQKWIRERIGGGTTAVLLICGLLLGCQQVSQAQPPKIIKSGPETATAGELVEWHVDFEGGEATAISWGITPEIRGRRQLLPTDDGRRCTLATYAGRFAVRVIASNADGHDYLTFPFTVTGGEPTPPLPEPEPVPPGPLPPAPEPIPPEPVPPQPDPQPAPGPVLPDGEFGGIPQRARDAALLVRSPARASEAALLAQAFESVAAQCAAGTLSTPYAAVQMLNARKNELLAAQEAWQPFITSCTAFFAKADDDVRTFGRICAEIAIGLETITS